MFVAQVDVKTKPASRQWASPKKLRRSLVPATQAASATSKIEELAAAKIDYCKRRTNGEEERHVLDMEVGGPTAECVLCIKTEQGCRMLRPVVYCWQIFFILINLY